MDQTTVIAESSIARQFDGVRDMEVEAMTFLVSCALYPSVCDTLG